MKLVLNNTEYDKSIALHSKQNKAKYFEIVAVVLTEYEVKSSKHLIYQSSLAVLNERIKNHLENANISSNNVTVDKTKRALAKLNDLGVIQRA